MKSNLDTPNQTEMIHTLKRPLAIIRSHSEFLLEAYDRLSKQQRVTLLKSVQSQTILLDHLLDEINRRGIAASPARVLSSIPDPSKEVEIPIPLRF